MSGVSNYQVVDQGFDVPGYKISQSQRNEWFLNLGANAENFKENIPNFTKNVRMNAIRLRTNGKLITSPGGDSNRIPSGSIEFSRAQIPTVSFVTSQEFNEETMESFSYRGISYMDLARNVAFQGANQVLATLALEGSGGAYEGFFNAAGKITTSALLAVDSFGETVLDNQSPTEIRDALIADINYQLALLNLIGEDSQCEIVLTMSQRTLATLTSKIIPVLEGGNGLSWSIWKNLEEVFKTQGKTLRHAKADAQCKDKGTGGTGYDRILITIPTMPSSGRAKFNTNLAADQASGVIHENLLMYASNVTPYEVPTVIENDGMRYLYKISAVTPGWAIQSNTVQVIANVKMVA